MDKEKLQHYEKKLLEMKKGYEQLVKRMKGNGLGEELRYSISELSSYDNHPADLGSEVFERGKDIAVKENIEIQLIKIDDALAKISSGSYGKCDICGQEISVERLEAVPDSTMCVDCRASMEGEGDRHSRPLEEDVIVPPFGGRAHDKSPEELGDGEDMNAFDGEDAWQSVAKFGTSETPSDVPNAGQYPDIYYDFDEDTGSVEDVDAIPYEVGDDGVIYEDFANQPAASTPYEKINLGKQE
jgi:YteA family regulatory protein